jgi:hypothetical protein
MINWYRVARSLKPYCPEGIETLSSMLKYLYEVKKKSTQDLVDLAYPERMSWMGMYNKLKSLNITMRPQGGDNCSKQIILTKQDFLEYSVRELAKMFNVSTTTIYDRKNKLLGKEEGDESYKDNS